MCMLLDRWLFRYETSYNVLYSWSFNSGIRDTVSISYSRCGRVSMVVCVWYLICDIIDMLFVWMLFCIWLCMYDRVCLVVYLSCFIRGRLSMVL